MPRSEYGDMIVCLTIYGCENGVRVVLDLERSGWRKITGSDRVEYVATDMSDLESILTERVLGRQKVAEKLEKCLTSHGLMVK